MVPQCTSTTTRTPGKLFIHVPRTANSRTKWLQLARRDPALIATQSKMYFCEDHFDLPKDMENYTEYHLMGFVSKVQMKADCLPSKFECQPDRKRRTASETARPLAIKRQRLETIAECEREIQRAQNISIAEIQPGPSSDTLPPACEIITTDKSIQVYICNKFRSKSTQTQTICRNMAVSPMKNLTACVSTSPFKLEVPSTSGHVKTSRKLCFSNRDEQFDSDVSLFTPSVTRSNSSSSLMSSQHLKFFNKRRSKWSKILL